MSDDEMVNAMAAAIGSVPYLPVAEELRAKWREAKIAYDSQLEGAARGECPFPDSFEVEHVTDDVIRLEWTRRQAAAALTALKTTP